MMSTPHDNDRTAGWQQPGQDGNAASTPDGSLLHSSMLPRISSDGDQPLRSNQAHQHSANQRAAAGQYDRTSTGGFQPSGEAMRTGSFQPSGAAASQPTGGFVPSGSAAPHDMHAGATGAQQPVHPQQPHPGTPGAPQPGQGHPGQTGQVGQPGANGQQRRRVHDPRQNQPHRRTPNGRYANGRSANAQHGSHAARVKPATPTPHVSGANGGRYVPMAVNSAHAKRPSRRSKKPYAIIAIVLVVALGVLGVYGYNTWNENKPVDVTINGTTYTVNGDERVISGILDDKMVEVQPGDYVAIDESVIRAGEGNRATAKVNGEEVSLDTRLWGGEEVELTNGADITEPYTDSNEQTIPHTMKVEGVGAYHVFQNEGKDGTKVTRTGNESGISMDIVREPAEDKILKHYNTHTNGDKVICLTIDDGPWDSTTEQILDILKENDAHATFYTIGEQIQHHADTVKRAADEGNEIATHTWDHAAGSGQGVSLIYMSADERKQEVEKGLQAIRDLGIEPSVYFRAPGGNYDESVANDLSGLVKGEMGWNIDTQDWQRPGTQAIADAIMRLDPGEMALMHDGGGNREQTVEALRIAIPAMKAKGFEFITVSEMIERYPYQEGQENPGTFVAPQA